MAKKGAEKIIEALTQLMDGFTALQASAEEEVDQEISELEEDSDTTNVDAAIVNEMKLAMESMIETEDYSTEEIATLLSTMTDALEEIDPNVFSAEEGEDEDDDDEVDDDDDDLEDLDDDDLLEDEDLDDDDDDEK